MTPTDNGKVDFHSLFYLYESNFIKVGESSKSVFNKLSKHEHDFLLFVLNSSRLLPH